jgi:hypothetical protein
LFTDTGNQPDDKVNSLPMRIPGFHYGFFYEVLKALLVQIGYTTVTDALLTDFATIRTAEFASRLRSIELMIMDLGIRQSRER